MPGGQSEGRLANPNTSSPSRCGRWSVKDDPIVKFAIVATSLARSLDPCALLNNNSFLSSPWPTRPPYKYCLYNVNYLKAQTSLDVAMYRQVSRFFDYHNQMLCIVSTKLQVGMFTHSSSLNFYRSKEMKRQQNLKCQNRVGMRVQMELESKWNYYVKCK